MYVEKSNNENGLPEYGIKGLTAEQLLMIDQCLNAKIAIACLARDSSALTIETIKFSIELKAGITNSTK